MNIRSVITIALLLLAVAGVGYVLMGGQGGAGDTSGTEIAAVAATDDLPVDGVVVYYFHGTKRCLTCNKMESLAEAVVNIRFGGYVDEGAVVFKPVNVETDETRHFVADFGLTTKTVVMVERRDGRDQAWRRLDEVWDKIGEEAAYRDYIAENLSACLVHTLKEAG